jgi:hypothetical protein
MDLKYFKFNKKDKMISKLEQSENNKLLPFQMDISTKSHKSFVLATIEEILHRINKGEDNYYENFTKAAKYNLVYDLDIVDTDEIRKSKDIIKDIIGRSKSYFKKLTGSDKLQVIKMKSDSKKLSYHILLRHETHVFNTIYDVGQFVSDLKFDYKCVDNSIYGKKCLRLLHCSKLGKNNTLKYVGRQKIDPLELFKLSMAGYITEDQTNIIKLTRDKEKTHTPSSNNISKTIRSIKKSGNIKSLDKFLIHIFKKEIEYSVKKKNDSFFVNLFTNECKACKKKHERNDGCYLIIKSSSFYPLDIDFRCFHSNKIRSFKLTKIEDNTDKIDKLMISVLKCFYDVKKIDNSLFSSFIPPSLDEMKDINKIKDIEYIKYDEKYCKKIDMKYDTIVLKAEMGSGKTYTISNAIRDQINKKKGSSTKNYLVICPLIATNSEIHKKLNNPTSDQIQLNNESNKFDYYSSLTNKQLQKSQHLVITPDSLPRLLSEIDDQKQVKTPPYVLWIDEIKSFFPYVIGNSTLSKKRKIILDIIQYYIKYAKKLIVSDADVDVEIIKWIKSLRSDKQTVVYQNIRKSIKRECFIYKENTSFKTKIFNDLDSGKKVYICADSRLAVNDLHDIIHRRCPKLNIIKYTSETIETNKIHFKDCNKYFTDYDVVLISPSVQYGLSFDKHYFDCVYGIFSGKTVTPRCANQMLGRVRKIKSKTLILCLDYYNTHTLVTDRSKILKTFQNNTSYFTHASELYDIASTEINRDGFVVFKEDDFITNIILDTTIEINKGMNNFTRILESYICKQDITIHRQLIGRFDIENDKIKKPEIDYGMPIINEKELETASHEETDRFFSHKLYGLKNQLDIPADEKSKKYYEIVKEIKTLFKKKTKQKFRNLKQDMQERLHAEEDIVHKVIIENSAKENLKDVMNIVGFKDIYDPSTIKINSTDKLDLSDELIQDIHVNFGDKGRLNTEEKTPMTIISYCSRLMEEHYGSGLIVLTKKKQLNKKRFFEYSVNIKHDHVLFELLINKASRHYKSDRKDKIAKFIEKRLKSNNKFKKTHLHDSNGDYIDKLSERDEDDIDFNEVL